MIVVYRLKGRGGVRVQTTACVMSHGGPPVGGEEPLTVSSLKRELERAKDNNFLSGGGPKGRATIQEVSRSRSVDAPSHQSKIIEYVGALGDGALPPAATKRVTEFISPETVGAEGVSSDSSLNLTTDENRRLKGVRFPVTGLRTVVGEWNKGMPAHSSLVHLWPDTSTTITHVVPAPARFSGASDTQRNPVTFWESIAATKQPVITNTFVQTIRNIPKKVPARICFGDALVFDDTWTPFVSQRSCMANAVKLAGGDAGSHKKAMWELYVERVPCSFTEAEHAAETLLRSATGSLSAAKEFASTGDKLFTTDDFTEGISRAITKTPSAHLMPGVFRTVIRHFLATDAGNQEDRLLRLRAAMELGFSLDRQFNQTYIKALKYHLNVLNALLEKTNMPRDVDAHIDHAWWVGVRHEQFKGTNPKFDAFVDAPRPSSVPMPLRYAHRFLAYATGAPVVRHKGISQDLATVVVKQQDASVYAENAEGYARVLDAKLKQPGVAVETLQTLEDKINRTITAAKGALGEAKQQERRVEDAIEIRVAKKLVAVAGLDTKSAQKHATDTIRRFKQRLVEMKTWAWEHAAGRAASVPVTDLEGQALAAAEVDVATQELASAKRDLVIAEGDALQAKHERNLAKKANDEANEALNQPEAPTTATDRAVSKGAGAGAGAGAGIGLGIEEEGGTKAGGGDDLSDSDDDNEAYIQSLEHRKRVAPRTAALDDLVSRMVETNDNPQKAPSGQLSRWRLWMPPAGEGGDWEPVLVERDHGPFGEDTQEQKDEDALVKTMFPPIDDDGKLVTEQGELEPATFRPRSLYEFYLFFQEASDQLARHADSVEAWAAQGHGAMTDEQHANILENNDVAHAFNDAITTMRAQVPAHLTVLKNTLWVVENNINTAMREGRTMSPMAVLRQAPVPEEDAVSFFTGVWKAPQMESPSPPPPRSRTPLSSFDAPTGTASPVPENHIYTQEGRTSRMSQQSSGAGAGAGTGAGAGRLAVPTAEMDYIPPRNERDRPPPDTPDSNAAVNPDERGDPRFAWNGWTETPKTRWVDEGQAPLKDEFPSMEGSVKRAIDDAISSAPRVAAYVLRYGEEWFQTVHPDHIHSPAASYVATQLAETLAGMAALILRLHKMIFGAFNTDLSRPSGTVAAMWNSVYTEMRRVFNNLAHHEPEWLRRVTSSMVIRNAIRSKPLDMFPPGPRAAVFGSALVPSHIQAPLWLGFHTQQDWDLFVQRNQDLAATLLHTGPGLWLVHVSCPIEKNTFARIQDTVSLFGTYDTALPYMDPVWSTIRNIATRSYNFMAPKDVVRELGLETSARVFTRDLIFSLVSANPKRFIATGKPPTNNPAAFFQASTLYDKMSTRSRENAAKTFQNVLLCHPEWINLQIGRACVVDTHCIRDSDDSWPGRPPLMENTKWWVEHNSLILARDTVQLDHGTEHPDPAVVTDRAKEIEVLFAASWEAWRTTPQLRPLSSDFEIMFYTFLGFMDATKNDDPDASHVTWFLAVARRFQTIELASCLPKDFMEVFLGDEYDDATSADADAVAAPPTTPARSNMPPPVTTGETKSPESKSGDGDDDGGGGGGSRLQDCIPDAHLRVSAVFWVSLVGLFIRGDEKRWEKFAPMLYGHDRLSTDKNAIPAFVEAGAAHFYPASYDQYASSPAFEQHIQALQHCLAACLAVLPARVPEFTLHNDIDIVPHALFGDVDGVSRHVDTLLMGLRRIVPRKFLPLVDIQTSSAWTPYTGPLSEQNISPGKNPFGWPFLGHPRQVLELACRGTKRQSEGEPPLFTGMPDKKAFTCPPPVAGQALLSSCESRFFQAELWIPKWDSNWMPCSTLISMPVAGGPRLPLFWGPDLDNMLPDPPKDGELPRERDRLFAVNMMCTMVAHATFPRTDMLTLALCAVPVRLDGWAPARAYVYMDSHTHDELSSARKHPSADAYAKKILDHNVIVCAPGTPAEAIIQYTGGFSNTDAVPLIPPNILHFHDAVEALAFRRKISPEPPALPRTRPGLPPGFVMSREGHVTKPQNVGGRPPANVFASQIGGILSGGAGAGAGAGAAVVPVSQSTDMASPFEDENETDFRGDDSDDGGAGGAVSPAVGPEGYEHDSNEEDFAREDSEDDSDDGGAGGAVSPAVGPAGYEHDSNEDSGGAGGAVLPAVGSAGYEDDSNEADFARENSEDDSDGAGAVASLSAPGGYGGDSSEAYFARGEAAFQTVFPSLADLNRVDGILRPPGAPAHQSSVVHPVPRYGSNAGPAVAPVSSADERKAEAKRNLDGIRTRLVNELAWRMEASDDLRSLIARGAWGEPEAVMPPFVATDDTPLIDACGPEGGVTYFNVVSDTGAPQFRFKDRVFVHPRGDTTSSPSRPPLAKVPLQHAAKDIIRGIMEEIASEYGEAVEVVMENCRDVGVDVPEKDPVTEFLGGIIVVDTDNMYKVSKVAKHQDVKPLLLSGGDPFQALATASENRPKPVLALSQAILVFVCERQLRVAVCPDVVEQQVVEGAMINPVPDKQRPAFFRAVANIAKAASGALASHNETQGVSMCLPKNIISALRDSPVGVGVTDVGILSYFPSITVQDAIPTAFINPHTVIARLPRTEDYDDTDPPLPPMGCGINTSVAENRFMRPLQVAGEDD